MPLPFKVPRQSIYIGASSRNHVIVTFRPGIVIKRVSPVSLRTVDNNRKSRGLWSAVESLSHEHVDLEFGRFCWRCSELHSLDTLFRTARRYGRQVNRKMLGIQWESSCCDATPLMFMLSPGQTSEWTRKNKKTVFHNLTQI